VSVAAAGETALAPLSPKELPPPVGPAMRLRDQELWVWLALVALALLGLEWFTYHRRITV
jgi:hypothetical protein